MRSVTAPTTTALALKSTQPAYLVAINFDGGVVRYCTRGTVSWDGVTWLGAAMTVEPPTDNQPGGRISFVDPDYAVHALIFSGAFKSRQVDVWAFWGNALAADDPVHVARCITAGAESTQGRRTIGLARQKSSLLQCPRQIIGPTIGVNHIASPGTEIAWGGRILTLEVRDA